MGPPHSSLFPSPGARQTQWAAQPWPADERPAVAQRDFSGVRGGELFGEPYAHHHRPMRDESREPPSELFAAMAADDALLDEIVGGDALSVSALGELLEARRGRPPLHEAAAAPEECDGGLGWGLGQ